MLGYGYVILPNRFCRHKNHTFHKSLMFLSFYISLHYSFHEHIQHNFHELGNYSVQNVFQATWQMVSSEVGHLWYKCPNEDLLCCQGRVRLTHEQALYVLMKRMVQANMKKQNYQTSVKNAILMSAKTVSSDTIHIGNQKGNRLCDIFAIRVAFFWFIFCFFRVFLLISYLF